MNVFCDTGIFINQQFQSLRPSSLTKYPFCWFVRWQSNHQNWRWRPVVRKDFITVLEPLMTYKSVLD